MRMKFRLYQKIVKPLSFEQIISKLIPICLIIAITSIVIAHYVKAGTSVQSILQDYNLEANTIHRNQTINSTNMDSEELQKGIATEILRFHVIANSDSTEDQALKLIIKDALVKSLQPSLQNAKDITEARNILKENLTELENISNSIIKEHGFTYTASASLEQGYFPLKVYGDLSLPPGEYEAVRVELGSAQGKNWWCVMFPPLCFVDSTYSVVPDSSKEELKKVLTDEEYEAVFSNKKVDVKVKFKLLEWLEHYFD